MPRVTPRCCVQFSVTLIATSIIAASILHQGDPVNDTDDNVDKPFQREETTDIAREVSISSRRRPRRIPSKIGMERDNMPFHKNQVVELEQKLKDVNAENARLKQEKENLEGATPPPPTTRPDDFRFDPQVPNEPLGILARQTPDKKKRIAEDEAHRMKALKHLTSEQEELKRQGYKNCQFNQYASDQLSLHRKGRDTRHPRCMDKTYYPSKKMPHVSVIIVFYNEARSTLLRTAWSVLDRTPDYLIKEVILVDDGSDREHLKGSLEAEVSTMPKTRVVRMVERGGLIRAKVHGVENATGEVLVFIDSHCEVNDGWLEPLLDRIVRNRKTIAMPVIDVIDMDSFEVKQAIIEKGVFSWTQYFYWLSPSGHAMEDTRHHDLNTDPLVCPVMAGGIFAIEKDYFWESGAYDMGQDTWGGENMEMSFRLWMCGARLEVMPCSRIAHVFRNRSPYSFKDRDPGKTIAHNLNRVAEVWMDDYAAVYYNLTGNKHIGYGDIAARQQFREEHECKSFKWYLDTVAPYMFVPMPGNYHAFGKLRNIGTNLCVDHSGRDAGGLKRGKLTDCTRNWGHALEWYLTKTPFDGELRHEASYGSRCIYVRPNDKKVSLETCYNKETGATDLYWSYSSSKQLLSKAHPGKCLAASGLNTQITEMSLEDCSEDKTQMWEFDAVW